MRRQVIAAALVGTLALVGCGATVGGTSLDRDASVYGMTLSVPSSWDETDHGGTATFDGPEDDEGRVSDAIIVSHRETSETLDEYAEDAYEGAERVSETEVDGCECSVYDFDGTSVAVIDGGGVIYDVMVLGDAVSLDDVLGTVAID